LCIKEPKKKRRAKKAKVTLTDVFDVDAIAIDNDVQPKVKSEPIDEPLSMESERSDIPTAKNTIVDQPNAGMVTGVETSTPDDVTKLALPNIDTEDAVAEKGTSRTSKKTVAGSSRVTRQSKQLKTNADPLEGPIINDAEQTDFIMKLFQIKSESNSKRSC
jgi:hypothetical protein